MLVILWMALHSAKIIFAVFVNLFIGLSITTAVGLMMVGSLNLLSIAFCRAVRRPRRRLRHPVQRRATAPSASRTTICGWRWRTRRGAPAVPLSLAAMATAAGFLCFLPTDYKGISELGKIAGAGMLVAFITSITVLPALLNCSIRPAKASRSATPSWRRSITSWKSIASPSSSARCWSRSPGCRCSIS